SKTGRWSHVYHQIASKKAIHDAYNVYRQLQYSIGVLNAGSSEAIFCSKVGFMAMSVSLFYYGIRIYSYSILFGLISLSLSLTSTVFYVIIYEKAFYIPMKMQEYKEELQISIESMFTGKEKSAMKRAVNSIYCGGIRVGSFRFMERTSAPDFIHFFILRVVDLVITF
ncbi:unnamed protein product, partial [Allacma fusca]